MGKRVLIPIPNCDFDPTESGVPWRILKDNGVDIIFATPNGTPGVCDERMLSGKGLGPLSRILAANKDGRLAYFEMTSSREFQRPIKWEDINVNDFDGLILPGGHAKGMREYLESSVLQSSVANFFEANFPVGAICHGVVLAARSKRADTKSVLFGKKTTALLKSQELMAWMMTKLWLKDYYRTYPQTVEDEVKSSLQSPDDFVSGPTPISRDSSQNLNPGFALVDDKYVSARWPGDAHAFSYKFLEKLLGST
ncbi:MAG: DJ-1/PfpI family protein [Bdellovibrionales bacterium]|nr:DJ-1/PfpI family protein [Bdellovibrionales bacterium]